MIEQLFKSFRNKTLSQKDYEISYLHHMCVKHRINFPETEENFEILFEEILIKLSHHEELTEHEWESVQRLYSIVEGVLLMNDIKEAFGYDHVE